MYLLYLDDSGSIANLKENYFVLGGVCLSESSTRWLSYQLEALATQICPDNPRQIEFHASEIYGGRSHPWDRYKKREERIDIIKRVLCILKDAYQDIVIFACAIHKASYPQSDHVIMAFEDLSSRFDMYLQRISNEEAKQRGLIILDKSSHETNLQNVAAKFRREGNRWGNQLRNICEVPLFVDSSASRIIQLADHIAYAVFRRYNAGDLNYFNCIESRFDEHQGVMHGLVHLQAHTPTCTCPACLTRRLNQSNTITQH